MSIPKTLLICNETFQSDIFNKENPYKTTHKVHYISAGKLFNPPFFQIVISTRDEDEESLKLLYNMTLINGFLIVKENMFYFFKDYKITKKFKDYYMIQRLDNIVYIPKEIKYRVIDAIIIGAQKCSTTSAAHNLGLHPDISMPKEELHIFEHPLNPSTSFKNIKWYKNNFDYSKKITCHKDPDILYLDYTWNIINQLNPFVKLIIFLRNPVDRVVSNYFMLKSKWGETKTLETLLFEELEYRKNEIKNLQTSTYHMIGRSMYYEQISKLLHFFPIQNICVLIMEDIKLDKEKEYNKIYEFLNLDKKYGLNYTDEHIGSYEKINSTLYEKMKNLFREDVKNLEKLLNIQTGWGF